MTKEKIKNEMEMDEQNENAYQIMRSNTDMFSTLLQKQWTSLDLSIPENQNFVFNALTAPDHKLKDYINKDIKISDIIIEEVQLPDMNGTGELKDCKRTILIDENGETYSAVSEGIFGSISRIFSTKGFPNQWDESLTVKVVSQETKKGFSVLLLLLA